MQNLVRGKPLGENSNSGEFLFVTHKQKDVDGLVGYLWFFPVDSKDRMFTSRPLLECISFVAVAKTLATIYNAFTGF